MTKERAIQLMEQGKKVTHRFFSNTEYITIKDGKILTEAGYSCTQKFFWADRTLKEWDHDWEEFKESPSVNDPSVLKSELRKFTYKGREVAILFHFYEDAETKEQFTTSLLDQINIAHVHHQYNTQSPSSIEESGLKEGEDVLRDMYNDECCLKHILLKAVNEIIAGTGENALEIAKKAKLEYEDIVQMK